MSHCVDCHAHFLPDPFVARLAELGLAAARKDAESIELTRAVSGYSEERSRLPYFPMLYDVERRVFAASEQGIERQILSLPPFYFAYAAAPELGLAVAGAANDALAEIVAQAPEVFASFATVPLQAPQLAVRELRRAVNHLGHWGVAIGTNVAGAPLDDPGLDPFWEAVCALDVPVFVHPHHELGGERAAPYYLSNLFGNPSETALAMARLIFAGVLDRFPTLHLILAHGGGTLPYIVGRLDHGRRVRPEAKALPAPPSSYLSRFYYDTVTHDDALLAYLVQRVGYRNVVVGTDRPYDMGIDYPRETVARIPGLDKAAESAILWDNLTGLLTRAPASTPR